VAIRFWYFVVSFWSSKQRILVITCCLLVSVMVVANSEPTDIDVMIESRQLTSGSCSGRFITRELDHITTTPNGFDIKQFEANGSGVAINDLDNDGDLDIVLANHGGNNSILWNEGDLNFTRKALPHGDSRAVTIVDVDNDGWHDILFTRTVTAPTFWRNLGGGQFDQEFIRGIAEPLYSVAWADLDNDGDLDLVGASYDAVLLEAFGQDFLINRSGGVFAYTNDNGTFRPTRLISEAQALAIVLVDLNHDSRLDIVVGNDFAVPDYIWMQSGEGWQEAHPFDNFTYSTMSYDFADLDNDGTDELFATDMQPYQTDEATLSAWRPLIDGLFNEQRPPDGPQMMQNILLAQASDTTYGNMSNQMGIEATGWSWSGKFGDLDQDGFLDLYVVNGFIEYTIFGHLPNHELVEDNQAFQNVDGQVMQRMPEWGLGSSASGRGMSMADLDNDGDLDIVVNNLRHPAQLFENQLCSGNSLQVDLNWDNHSVVATEVVLHTSTGTYHRHVKSVSGYLSGDPDRVHFGIPDTAVIQSLDIMWSDGAQSTVTLTPDMRHIIITRGT